MQDEVDAELALDALDGHVDVLLAHAGHDRLAGLGIATNLDGRIFFGESVQRGAELVEVGLRLRLDGDREDRPREVDRREADLLLLEAERVARPGLLQLRHGADVAGRDLRHRRLGLAADQEELRQPLVTAARRVPQVAVALDGAAEDAEVGETADERVGGGLEDQRCWRAVGVRRELDLLA
jgi:hypothetical protein